MFLTDFVLWFVSGLLSILFFIAKRSKVKNYPPGPWGLPLIGHLLMMGTEPHKTFVLWKKKYGPIFAVDFGSFRSVIISDYKLIREALNNPAFSGRPILQFMLDRSGGEMKGIMFNEGEDWAEQRRFTLRHLNDFGFGNKSIETIIQDEITELIEQFQNEVGKPMSTQNRFNTTILNALWTIIAGKRFKQDDPEAEKIIELLTSIMHDNNILSGLSIFMPWLTKVAPKLSGYERLMTDVWPAFAFLKKHIDFHKRTFQAGQNRDFMDVYLNEIKNTGDPDSGFYREKGVKSILFVIADLFGAGTETTSTTLSWTFLYMAKYPAVQLKLQKEIDTVVSRSGLPSLSDRSSMPYTEAVIHEILRYSCLTPFSVFHKTTEEVHFGGYIIPKDTMIVPNMYDIHFDPLIWGDPEVFRPERFLSGDEKFVQSEAFMPFSFGKRSCPGESLARDELFLFITSLFQRFSVSPNPNQPYICIEPIVRNVLIPKPHLLVVSQR